ncbi:MAG TPA: hypothetical protein VMK53_06675, partial [Gemmatimonadales bacterium]|nr:hypothetical protein [Gemmatimonadales bacterium]
MAGWFAARTLIVVLALAACSGGAPALRQVEVVPDMPLGGVPGAPTGPGNLQVALEGLTGPARLRLAPGHYLLQPAAYTDPTCGNCEDPATSVPATLGLRLSGTRLELIGAGADSVFIHTNAGYGLLIEDCAGCVVRGVTITSGVRDPDGQATNGAIVIRRS